MTAMKCNYIGMSEMLRGIIIKITFYNYFLGVNFSITIACRQSKIIMFAHSSDPYGVNCVSDFVCRS